jgi:hypothetical protein
MVTEKTKKYILRSKTGWTRVDGYDMGGGLGMLNAMTMFISLPRELGKSVLQLILPLHNVEKL